ncbi:GMC oxidoreductase [Fomitopsis betulina]|nr:GMC oxidoreductase [Fomitopsis betulina]
MIAPISNVVNSSFDYVIIGGGTSGLTVAGRLAERSKDSTILVLEAGEANCGDGKVLLGGTFGSTFGDLKYDWAFTTTPQKHSNDRVTTWNRGKGLGGSSGMNFMIWGKPSATDMDALESLGNPGWNWKNFEELTLRVEDFTEASADQHAESKHTHNAAHRGKGGPLKTTVPGTVASLNNAFLETLQNMGVPLLDDAYGGNVTGCWQASSCLDRASQWTRSYAATAYCFPHQDNPKLRVLTEATASRIIFANELDSEGNLVANKVEFLYDGKKYTARVNKEVICSAGTIKSPQILELSGIGRRDVLDCIGVKPMLELPGVGENISDHTVCCIPFELDPTKDHKTFDIFRNTELAKEQARLQSMDEDNMHRYGISALAYLPLQTISPDKGQQIITSAENMIRAQMQEGKLPIGLAEQYEIQLRLLKDTVEPDLELAAVPGYLNPGSIPSDGKSYLTLLSVLQHPFSRGTVHCRSDNPLDQPEIDPHTFENPYDLELLKENVKYVRRMAAIEPLRSIIALEANPGKDIETDNQIKEYIKDYNFTCYHALGSLSMLPRDCNGVVDCNLKVYGTRNLRVADLSVIPMQVSAHTQSIAYYIGEKMAEILLQ